MVLGFVIFLAVLQGATELFPISSLGHAVLIPPLLHLGFRQTDANFVPVLVLLHLGTAGALLVLYWREWRSIVAGFVRAALRGAITTPAERMAMLLAVGTIPAGIIGFFAEKSLKSLFATPSIAAACLILNGGILAGAEMLRRRDERRRDVAAVSDTREAAYDDAEQLSFRAALLVGLCQATALVPGISRSGATMAGGLMAGLRHDQAVRFSFLLATPIILAAGLLETPQLTSDTAALPGYILGAVIAGVVAYASARFLLRYFRSGRLEPFAVYCVGVGIIGLAFVH